MRLGASFRVLVVVVVVIGVFVAGAAQAAIVAPGWDLLETAPGTQFMGAPFVGVPLGTYDFGGTIGVQNVGTTDTIVQRLAPSNDVTPVATDTVDIQLVALQLMSVAPIDLGAGTDFYFITLQSARSPSEGGPMNPSLGHIDITFDDPLGGTFDSFFDVFFDIRLSDLNGTIVQSGQLPLSSSNNPWGREPPPGALEIPGVNMNLNGNDNTQDFWPLQPIQEEEPNVAAHVVIPGRPVVPEATSIAVWGLLSSFAAVIAWRRSLAG
jgi:hypothetical protein